MHAAHLIPDVAIARVLTGGGPYQPGDELSLAFTTPTVSRLVAHDTDVRAKCVPLEGALVPEMISVVIIHRAAAYGAGDVLTLSFVDPRIARVQLTAERRQNEAGERVASERTTLDPLPEKLSVEPAGENGPRERASAEAASERHDFTAEMFEYGAASTTPSREPTAAKMRGDAGVDSTLAAAAGDAGDAGAARRDVRGPEPISAISPDTQTLPQELQGAPFLPEERDTPPARTDARYPAPTPPGDRYAQTQAEERYAALIVPEERYAAQISSERSNGAVSPGDHSTRTTDSSATSPLDGMHEPAQLQAAERMTLQESEFAAYDETRNAILTHANGHDASMRDRAVGERRATGPALPNERVTVRLEWPSERLRRFVQVIDKLFTIDRLGWYRHSLAMRLLIPDEITCGDTLATVEAMRHLHALRTAAVECLGKPLLAACMPGFSISSEWLETLESSREARAIAGLREALLPYSDDREDTIDPPADAALCTLGTVTRHELLAENATSVEAFLPLLIPTRAHDAELGVRLAEYRRLLLELFSQTARASESVRLHQMAQPNHSLDDRLWQLVGAAAEAFGGFAHA